MCNTCKWFYLWRTINLKQRIRRHKLDVFHAKNSFCKICSEHLRDCSRIKEQGFFLWAFWIYIYIYINIYVMFYLYHIYYMSPVYMNLEWPSEICICNCVCVASLLKNIFSNWIPEKYSKISEKGLWINTLYFPVKLLIKFKINLYSSTFRNWFCNLYDTYHTDFL